MRRGGRCRLAPDVLTAVLPTVAVVNGDGRWPGSFGHDVQGVVPAKTAPSVTTNRRHSACFNRSHRPSHTAMGISPPGTRRSASRPVPKQPARRPWIRPDQDNNEDSQGLPAAAGHAICQALTNDGFCAVKKMPNGCKKLWRGSRRKCAERATTAGGSVGPYVPGASVGFGTQRWP